MRTINVKYNSSCNYSLFENDIEIGNLIYKDQRLSFAIYKTKVNNYYVINESTFFKHEFKIIHNQKNIFGIKIKQNCRFTIVNFENEKTYTLNQSGLLFRKGQPLSYQGKVIIQVKRKFNWKKFRTEYIMNSKLDNCEDHFFFIAIYCETYYDNFLTD
ncbi:hypothetical protein [Flavobacterium sp.]|uniref:hypothetical protein n=1 Tax=Flavobacterium sp. TaxID=239 RepID=UPI0038FCAB03